MTDRPAKRTLLLTDIPPCSNLTAGIVTAQMCRFVPPDELAIFCVTGRHVDHYTNALYYIYSKFLFQQGS